MSLNYTTVERIFQQVPLLDDAAIVSSAQVATYAQDAEAEIDGALAGRFTVPVADDPPLLRAVATKLAAGMILSQKVFTQERLNDSDWPEAFLTSARDTLEKLASGEMTLVASGGAVISARNDLSEVWSNTADYEPTMTELDPSRQIIDPDKIDDIESDRGLGDWPDRLIT